jgi:hypothetical protein
MSSSGCSAISAAKSPKSSTSSAVSSSSSILLSFSFGSAVAAGSCKVLLQQRFLLKLKFYDCPFSWYHRYGNKSCILIMVAIGGLYHKDLRFPFNFSVVIVGLVVP